MKKFLLLLMIPVLMNTGCQKDTPDTPVDNFDPAIARVLKDEIYGTDAYQKADIHLPANRSAATKTLIILHGGSWAAGDKADIDSFILVLKKTYPELAIVNMNYRLATATANKYPTQIDDIHKLLAFTDSKKDSWHISGNYAIGGVSAGGQLALMYAYKFDTAKKIKAVVSVVGPTNFIDPFYLTNPLFQLIAVNYIGVPITDTDMYKNASPAWVVTAGAPPTFLSYAGSDSLVPESNATFLRDKLIALGISYQYFFYPLEGHIYSNAALAETALKATAFLKLHL